MEKDGMDKLCFRAPYLYSRQDYTENKSLKDFHPYFNIGLVMLLKELFAQDSWIKTGVW